MTLYLLAADDVSTPFPDPETAMDDPNGLLIAGGSLSTERLLSAYRQGIFPWYNEDEPILWWCPNPRCVLWSRELKITRSLRKNIRSNRYEVRIDTAFPAVIENCRKPRPQSAGTWILPEMAVAYKKLHELGYAHSYETWENNKLVGGLYGVQLGQVFFGESMFSKKTDASKIALVRLCQNSAIKLIDCQIPSQHLFSLNARNIPRKQFIQLLSELI